VKAVKLERGLGCPSVGLWSPRVAVGAHLREGLVLGTLTRLGRRIPITAPAVRGQVGEIVDGSWLEYGDALLSLGVLDASVEVADEAEETHEGLVALRAPMAGTIYHRPSPGDPAFVEVGAPVARLGTVALMEVMKTFTAIKADAPGTLERWNVEDGGSVEAEGVIAWLRPG